MRLLESLGLGLLVTSVVIGMLSLWLNSGAGYALALRLPRLATVLHTKALMLLVMVLGIGLLLLGIFITPNTVPPAEPIRLKSAQLPAQVSPVVVTVPAPLPASSSPVQPDTPETDHSQPVPAAQPVKPMASLQAGAATPVAEPVARTKVDAPEAPSQKKNIFSPRCARLLEKVGAGEPMTLQEQTEMVSKCQ